MNAGKGFDGFDDLGDDFDSEIASPVTAGKPATLEDASGNKSIKPEGEMFEERCPKCLGSGRYTAPSDRGHVCFKCQGKGKLYFKKSAADRAASRQKSAARKAKKQTSNLDAFEAQNPAIKEWWDNSEYHFARSLRESVIKYGKLTDGQMAAALRAIDKIAEAKVAAVARVEHAKTLPTMNLEPIEAAIRKAAATGLLNPKVRLLAGNTSIIIYRAAAHSVNAGSLYVKSADEGSYLGKVTAGLFLRGRDVSLEQEADIVAACSDPARSAVAYGVATGQCSCCGRKLTNKLSIELGIGPICRETFFG